MTNNALDQNATTIKNLNARFKELCFCGITLSLLSGGVLIYNIIGPGEISEFDVDWGEIMRTPLNFLWFGVYVCGARLCYRAWQQIPADIARTTPGKAAGFLFIPLFNLYWIFVAFWGLAKDMNRTLAEQHGNQHQVNESMGLAVCILPIFNLLLIVFMSVLHVPSIVTESVATVIGVLNSIVWILFFKSMKESTIALLN